MTNTYLPKIVKIERIVRETPDIKTFYFKYSIDFTPGQFLEISCFGLGEAPISIASSPDENFLKISFKRIGNVTDGLFKLKEKDCLGLRGPLGKGFPLDDLKGKILVFIAGGIGIAPLRSLLKFLLSKNKAEADSVVLLYGARTPQDMLYKKELEAWSKSIKVLLTVDKPDSKWTGKVGVVTQLLNKVDVEPEKTKVFICGPEIMMRFTIEKLIKLKVNPADIILSLERYMKCGVGKCGHCYIADKFVCQDGPVFTYAQLNNLIPVQIL